MMVLGIHLKRCNASVQRCRLVSIWCRFSPCRLGQASYQIRADGAVYQRLTWFSRRILRPYLTGLRIMSEVKSNAGGVKSGVKTPVILPNLPHLATTEDARNTA
jgi:hypothetical protein